MTATMNTIIRFAQDENSRRPAANPGRKGTKKMGIKFKGNSGRVLGEDALKELYLSEHPNETEIGFDFWLYFGIEAGAIEVVRE